MTGLPPITEKQFQQQIMELAVLYKWRCYHTWSSMHSAGGFPDLVMVRVPRLIFAELKSDKGKVSIEQEAWLESLRASGKCEVYLWRPSVWESITEVLR